MLAADPRSDIPGQEMMISMCVRREGGGVFIHIMDVSVHGSIREYNCCL